MTNLSRFLRRVSSAFETQLNDISFKPVFVNNKQMNSGCDDIIKLKNHWLFPETFSDEIFQLED